MIENITEVTSCMFTAFAKYLSTSIQLYLSMRYVCLRAKVSLGQVVSW